MSDEEPTFYNLAGVQKVRYNEDQQSLVIQRQDGQEYSMEIDDSQVEQLRTLFMFLDPQGEEQQRAQSPFQ